MDLSTITFIVKDAPDVDSVFGGSSFSYDPTTKVQSKLGSLTADKLRNATLKNGEKLLSDDVAKSSAVEEAASQLSNLNSRMKKLSSSNSTTDAKESNSFTPSHFDSLSPSHVSSTANSLFSDWDIWYWLSKLGDAIKSWAITAWEFIVETAEGIYRFVLKTVSHIMKAVTWVFEKLKVAFKKLIEFLAFLFNWGDILDMHNVIVGIVNNGMDVIADATDRFSGAVDGWFEVLDSYIQRLDIPEEALKQTVNTEKNKNEKGDEALESPGGNWSNYQVEHGGVGKRMNALTTTGGAGGSLQPGNPLLQFWDHVLKPALQEAGGLISHLIDNVSLLFKKPNANISIGDIFKHIGIQLLCDLVKILRRVIVGLVQFSGGLIRDAKAVMNFSIDIPLLTPLYRTISGGNDLTMLDAVALLLAVPSTLLFKAATGKRPRDVPGFHDLFTKPSKTANTAPSSARSTVTVHVVKEENIAGKVVPSEYVQLRHTGEPVLTIDSIEWQGASSTELPEPQRLLLE